MEEGIGLEQVKELYSRYVVPTYGRFDLAPVKGKGSRVTDSEGRAYLDFGTGIAVCSLGHGPSELVEALAGQAAELIHTSNLYYIPQQAVLARELVAKVGLPGRIFFCNDGATANEALFKLARRYGQAQSGGEGKRWKVVTFANSFHGRTMAGIASTGQAKVKTGFEPLTPGFVQIPFNDLEAADAAINESTAAVLLEPIQGEGGIHIVDPVFLKELAGLCREREALLFFDEIQCGLGRTGDWCAWRTVAGDAVEPDGISWAKGMAGGFPMGAVWISDRERSLAEGRPGRLPDLLGPGSHGTTFGGTPLACAAALAVLKTIEEQDLLARARAAEQRLRQRLGQLNSPLLGEIRGRGLMLGLVLADPWIGHVAPATGESPAIFVVKQLQHHGLLAVPSGTHVVRLLPPLNVTDQELDDACDILEAVFRELEGSDT